MGERCCTFLWFLLLLLVAVSSGASVGERRRMFRPAPGEQAAGARISYVQAKGTSPKGKAEAPQPLQFFEVARPVNVPEGVNPCSVRLLEHSFAYTYGLPPAEAPFRPPANCGSKWDKVVLKWTGTSKGRQFDRISMLWLNGVEIFRTCTAEPVAQGIVWEVEKDVTRYSALFQEPGKLVLSLANVVDNTYTGIFNITLEALFYASSKDPSKRSLSEEAGALEQVDVTGFSSVADVILPVTQLPEVLGEGGYIQRIENSSHTVSVILDNIPKNVYRAVLELCVSFHENDEFWYANAPNIWITANNFSSTPGNGPYREVVASLDGRTVGAVWPFAVIYTGGLNPYLWRPAAAIGAFNLPSYDIEITPFVGSIVDGKNHTFSFAVTNALNVWFVQGNLHLWLDAQSPQTSGELEAYSVPGYSQKLNTHGYEGGLDGTFTTSASRRISYSGYVRSSYGKIISAAEYHYKFRNKMTYADQADTQRIDQDTSVGSRVVVKTEVRDLVNSQHSLSFPFRLNYQESELADKSYSISLNLTHEFEEDEVLILPSYSGASWFSSLHNSQTVSGILVIYPNNTNTGWSEAKQAYKFESSAVCYSREVVARNYTVLADDVENQCKSTVAW